MADSNFIDYVKIYCRSGNGGAGSTHMRREKYIPKGGLKTWRIYSPEKYQINIDGHNIEYFCRKQLFK
jgi:hypothetical protein